MFPKPAVVPLDEETGGKGETRLWKHFFEFGTFFWDIAQKKLINKTTFVSSAKRAKNMHRVFFEGQFGPFKFLHKKQMRN